MWGESSLNWVLEQCPTSSIALICQPRAIPSQCQTHPLVAKLRHRASPAKTAHVDPYFLFTRSPESGDALQGQRLALVSDLPRDDWWSDEHSARDLYDKLPPTEVKWADKTNKYDGSGSRSFCYGANNNRCAVTCTVMLLRLRGCWHLNFIHALCLR